MNKMLIVILNMFDFCNLNILVKDFDNDATLDAFSMSLEEDTAQDLVTYCQDLKISKILLFGDDAYFQDLKQKIEKITKEIEVEIND